MYIHFKNVIITKYMPQKFHFENTTVLINFMMSTKIGRTQAGIAVN